MTLISQSMNMNTSATTNGGTLSAKVTSDSAVTTSLAASGSTLEFDQALAQLMLGVAAELQVSTTGTSTLLGLLQSVSVDSVEEEEVNKSLTPMLEGLLSEVEKLDDVIAEDPSLMLVLQTWLQQVNVTINENDQVTHEADQGENDSLSLLAEHPSTIKFAVQDALTQLVSKLQTRDTSVNEITQAVQLLSSFKGLVEGTLTADSQQSKSSVSTPLQSSNPVVSVDLTSKNTQAVSNIPADTTVVEMKAATTTPVLQLNQLRQGLEQSNQPTVFNALETVEATTEMITNEELNHSEQSTVTVGQLAMRDGLKAPLAVAPSPVPVEQFTTEITKFIVNKLDIVKTNGMTEAKISLYPEHLGQVDIKITMLNGQMVASFMTEHAGTKDLLEQQMSQLRSALQSQGLNVEKLVVTQNQSLQSQMYHDGRQPNSGQQESNRRSKEREGHSDDSLVVAELTEEINEWLSRQEGSSEVSTFTAKA
ncbi:flagellar hook-length control protein FliK [Paenibacillus sp. DS2015]|uniref:flagellar hook-length control protein FliK n=1 Tax=Paenibacillus sp. DS2015 TaxID=3373917 RepID=UPI003D1E1E04